MAETKAPAQRPLSPHLQIYRPMLTMMMSIVHRITGAALYFGLLRIPTKHLFTVTSWLILLLAAGMASQAAAFLLQADLLPPLGPSLWDTSFLLSEHSLAGRVLHTLIGYTAQPAGIQLAFYLATLIVIGSLMRIVGGAPPTARQKAGTASRPAQLQPGE